MKEDLLYYLWKFQKFDKLDLKSTKNETIQVLSTGIQNYSSGPDFLNARILIDEIEWAGHVEMHIKASDWLKHKHQQDKAFDNVILHVVWEYDADIKNRSGEIIPTFELKGKVPLSFQKMYNELIDSRDEIPCLNQFSSIPEIVKINAMEKVLIERMERKANDVLQKLSMNGDDWEQTAFEVLAGNFGFKINNEAFFKLAHLLPTKILSKHKNNLFQIEALLFGMSGLLAGKDEYSRKLVAEFDYLAAKYGLMNEVLNANEWKFMRVRPSNFPTLRIAQLASIIHRQEHFFAHLIATESYENFVKLLSSHVSDYWQKHYQFGKITDNQQSDMGTGSINNLIINTIVPILFAYSIYTGDIELKEKAVAYLENIPAEKNRITRFWNNLGFKTTNMFETQASIELYNNYCSRNKCLNCQIGIEILRG